MTRRTFIPLTLFALACVVLLAWPAAAEAESLIMSEAIVSQCPPQHCQREKPFLKQKCRLNDWPAGKHVTEVLMNGVVCYCTCPGKDSSKPSKQS